MSFLALIPSAEWFSFILPILWYIKIYLILLFLKKKKPHTFKMAKLKFVCKNIPRVFFQYFLLKGALISIMEKCFEVWLFWDYPCVYLIHAHKSTILWILIIIHTILIYHIYDHLLLTLLCLILSWSWAHSKMKWFVFPELEFSGGNSPQFFTGIFWNFSQSSRFPFQISLREPGLEVTIFSQLCLILRRAWM